MQPLREPSFSNVAEPWSREEFCSFSGDLLLPGPGVSRPRRLQAPCKLRVGAMATRAAVKGWGRGCAHPILLTGDGVFRAWGAVVTQSPLNVLGLRRGHSTKGRWRVPVGLLLRVTFGSKANTDNKSEECATEMETTGAPGACTSLTRGCSVSHTVSHLVSCVQKRNGLLRPGRQERGEVVADATEGAACRHARLCVGTYVYAPVLFVCLPSSVSVFCQSSIYLCTLYTSVFCLSIICLCLHLYLLSTSIIYAATYPLCVYRSVSII